ncbi:MAG: S9 family peptidase [Candidatus Promineofilum sp.]|nr:S9 family peptidase [Promineifilum sp.]
MSKPAIAPYGSWNSPITSDLLVGGTISLSQPWVDGDAIYWVEGRPSEGGRNVIVRLASGRQEDVTPAGFNARTRVHEYGGGDYTVHDGVIYFSNFADQRLYRQPIGGAPEAITPAVSLRYADAIFDPARNRLICVREDHRTEGREAINTLVAIPTTGGEQTVLAEGHDFYATPRLSPDGHRLAWLTWDHPNMPWDGTQLWLADVAGDGSIGNKRLVAGGPTESVFQPAWSPDGVLYFISDRTGWWNLYRLNGDAAEALAPMEADFGMVQWVFGLGTYIFTSPAELICSYTQDGHSFMAHLDTTTKALSSLDVSGTLLYPSHSRIVAGDGFVVYIAASPTQPQSVVRYDLATGASEVLKRSTDLAIDEGYISIAQPIEFPTEGGLTAHGYYYPPRNREYTAPNGERPPLVVLSHGGPTSATTADFSLARQYWTSRGFALLDVNYGGSTGYGRAYRQRLNGNWGIVDVDDCANGARYLVEQGLADGDRLIIRGGSAGGYTTLCAITNRDVFKAAASHYGVSDAEALAQETHKFESRYLDNLIGPYPASRDIYMKRSPIHVADRCTAALILFQGLDDEVVPPNQSERMYAAVRRRKLPVAYVAFEGEGHGFRQAKNIKRAMEAELYFYGRVFGFEPAGDIEPVAIENLSV